MYCNKRERLADLIAEEQQSKITPQRIVHDVAQYFGIKSDDVLGDGQTRDRVLPRQLSMYLCRQELKMPYMKIGDIFGRDHSTVMSSIKLIQKELDADNGDVVSAYRAIMRLLMTKEV